MPGVWKTTYGAVKIPLFPTLFTFVKILIQVVVVLNFWWLLARLRARVGKVCLLWNERCWRFLLFCFVCHNLHSGLTRPICELHRDQENVFTIRIQLYDKSLVTTGLGGEPRVDAGVLMCWWLNRSKSCCKYWGPSTLSNAVCLTLSHMFYPLCHCHSTLWERQGLWLLLLCIFKTSITTPQKQIWGT